jgi:glycosyltransferase involved in cell wall biosynthesis
MSCGTPVVASDIPVTHEICGEAARYYRLGDPGDLAEKLLPLLTDAGARSNLARAGVERARDFTWRRAAECTMRLLTTSETGTDRLPETFDESER